MFDPLNLAVEGVGFDILSLATAGVGQFELFEIVPIADDDSFIAARIRARRRGSSGKQSRRHVFVTARLNKKLLDEEHNKMMFDEQVIDDNQLPILVRGKIVGLSEREQISVEVERVLVERVKVLKPSS